MFVLRETSEARWISVEIHRTVRAWRSEFIMRFSDTRAKSAAADDGLNETRASNSSLSCLGLLISINSNLMHFFHTFQLFLFNRAQTATFAASPRLCCMYEVAIQVTSSAYQRPHMLITHGIAPRTYMRWVENSMEIPQWKLRLNSFEPRYRRSRRLSADLVWQISCIQARLPYFFIFHASSQLIKTMIYRKLKNFEIEKIEHIV